MKNENIDTATKLAKEIYSESIRVYFGAPPFEAGIQKLADIIRPHLRKTSDRMMSDMTLVTGVPERCEEAYNEALSLMLSAANLFNNMSSKRGSVWLKMRDKFLQKPNPFKEADIIRDNENKKVPLAPFDLELAKNGAKVVTKDGLEVRIVADNLTGTFPILGVITKKDGSKYSGTFTEKGNYWESDSDKRDLFILEEPEMLDIQIWKDKYDNSYLFVTPSQSLLSKDYEEDYELIKTITVEI